MTLFGGGKIFDDRTNDKTLFGVSKLSEDTKIFYDVTFFGGGKIFDDRTNDKTLFGDSKLSENSKICMKHAFW